MWRFGLVESPSSSAERSKKSNGNIELRLENVKFDTAESITVQLKVFAFRANEKAQDNLAALEDGEYVPRQVVAGLWTTAQERCST